jgi:hypothetical protein
LEDLKPKMVNCIISIEDPWRPFGLRKWGPNYDCNKDFFEILLAAQIHMILL